MLTYRCCFYLSVQLFHSLGLDNIYFKRLAGVFVVNIFFNFPYFIPKRQTCNYFLNSFIIFSDFLLVLTHGLLQKLMEM